jgi:hypothetical protein
MRHGFSILVLVVAFAFAGPGLAAKGGKPGGGPAAQTASCSVSGSVVSATGLPTGEVINFMVTSAAGTTGWVLGISDNGTWSVPVPAPTGATTYQFVSKTWGPDGSKYDVFASCST